MKRDKRKKTVEFTLTDNSLMYFGPHKGKKLANLSNHYCRWLLIQDWIKEHVALYAYLEDNEELFWEDEES